MGIWDNPDIPSSKGLSPTTKGPVPSDGARTASKSWDIRVFRGEISQYTQFAAAFGRIVFGKSAANGQQIDSGAAIRKFSCRG